MKKLLLFVMFILPVATVFSQSQSEMNEAAAKSYAKADKEMNKVYQQILKKNAKNALFVKYMKEAQLRWIEFRDAEFKRFMPQFQKGNTVYGSSYSMDKNEFMENMTLERIKTLKGILKSERQ
jgi:uncharacterized protein YecT (DUF1311 family)